MAPPALARRAAGRRSPRARQAEADADDRGHPRRGRQGTRARAARGRAGGVGMILVIAEHNGRPGPSRRRGRPSRPPRRSAQPVTVVVAGQDLEALSARRSAETQVAQVLRGRARHAVGNYTADGYVSALADVIGALAPRAGAGGPHLSGARLHAEARDARCGRGLVSDCVAVKTEGDGFRFTRPVFQARLLADVRAQWCGAVLRDAAGRRGACRHPAEGQRPGRDAARRRSTRRPCGSSPRPRSRRSKQAVDLTAAERIVSVGRGIKGPEHIDLVKQLAEALGAELAASRPICDNGWLPMDRQIGSSGPDGRAEALPRPRHLRRDPARGRHEGREDDRRGQQGPRGADLRDRRLRHRWATCSRSSPR